MEVGIGERGKAKDSKESSWQSCYLLSGEVQASSLSSMWDWQLPTECTVAY
jgi:hypothetical protein